MLKEYYVYILANKYNAVLYIGITNDLEKRVFQHRNAIYNSFCNRYNIDKLVYFESCGNPEDAIRREKQIKKWNRKKKTRLVESLNPDWASLIN